MTQKKPRLAKVSNNFRSGSVPETRPSILCVQTLFQFAFGSIPLFPLPRYYIGKQSSCYREVVILGEITVIRATPNPSALSSSHNTAADLEKRFISVERNKVFNLISNNVDKRATDTSRLRYVMWQSRKVVNTKWIPPNTPRDALWYLGEPIVQMW